MEEQEEKKQDVVEEPKTTDAKNKEKPIETDTPYTDMNVEGFHWFNPNKKKGKTEKINVTRKEYWAMVRGAFASMLPLILCMLSAMGIVFLLAYLWLKP